MLITWFTRKKKLLPAVTCGVLCLLYFQNLPELRRSASLGSRASLSLWSSSDSSLFTPSRELVSIRKYFASFSSLVTLLKKLDEAMTIHSSRQADHDEDRETALQCLSYCASLRVSAVSFNRMSCSTWNGSGPRILRSSQLCSKASEELQHCDSRWGSHPCRSWEPRAAWRARRQPGRPGTRLRRRGCKCHTETGSSGPSGSSERGPSCDAPSTPVAQRPAALPPWSCDHGPRSKKNRHQVIMSNMDFFTDNPILSNS